MTDNQTTTIPNNKTIRYRIKAWLSETKTYPNGSTFSRGEHISLSVLALVVGGLILVIGIDVSLWCLNNLIDNAKEFFDK